MPGGPARRRAWTRRSSSRTTPIAGPIRSASLPYRPGFTGVAMSAEARVGNRLYVTDFQNNTIRVLDHQWVDITASVPFARPRACRRDFSPYNIQLLNGRLYVAFAAVDVGAEEPASDVPGPGVGHIVAYDLDGHIVQRNSPTPAASTRRGAWPSPPGSFGAFGGALLVGNFGDGTGHHRGLRSRHRDVSGLPARRVRQADRHRRASGAWPSETE